MITLKEIFREAYDQSKVILNKTAFGAATTAFIIESVKNENMSGTILFSSALALLYLEDAYNQYHTYRHEKAERKLEEAIDDASVFINGTIEMFEGSKNEPH